jgi:hypothetical protein
LRILDGVTKLLHERVVSLGSLVSGSPGGDRYPEDTGRNGKYRRNRHAKTESLVRVPSSMVSH